MLALAGCACILFAEVIKQWKSIFGFLGNVVSAMTPIIIGLVIAFMLNPIMIYIRRGLSFLICKIFPSLSRICAKSRKVTKIFCVCILPLTNSLIQLTKNQKKT